MSTFDNILKSTQRAGKLVADKASDIFDYTKTSVQIASISNKLEDAYARLGRLVYDEREGNDHTAEKDEVFAEISLIINELEEKRVEKAEAKNEMLCPTCGAPCAKDAVFCSNCGEKIKK